MLAAVAGAIAMPWLVKWYISWETGRTAILIAYYACLPFALTALVCLWKLLQNIRAEQVFQERNSRLMAVVSWCCAGVAVSCLVCGLWYVPLFMLAAAAAFMALIVRIVKNVFQQAIAMKSELDLTV